MIKNQIVRRRENEPGPKLEVTLKPDNFRGRFRRLLRSIQRYKDGYNRDQECARRLRQGDRLEMRRWPEDFV